jgi:Phage gp6-like head-tail connector protein
VVASNQLTSLANVKSWAGVTTTNDDNLLNLLIADVSRFILSYLQRPTLFQFLFNDVYDGVGQRAQMLRNWPVLSVASVTIDGVKVPALTNLPGCGYVLEPWDGFPPGRPQLLSMRGYGFGRGYSNIAISYTAGFVIQNEAQTVPTGAGPYTVTANAPMGMWGADQGVTYANGNALTAVASNPDQGQYSVTAGVYTFNAADAGQVVLISYSYVPQDIAHAAMEMVAERYRYKNRIGEVSKSLGGQETMSYSQKDMPDFIRTLLQPYKRVVLV